MEEKQKTISKSTLIKVCISLFIIIIIAIILAKYLINSDFRNTVDTKIFRKELNESVSNTIEINSDDKPAVYAYDKYITVLNKNVLNFYDKDSNLASKLDINITTPDFASNNKYLAIAENNGSKLYLTSDMLIKWEKDLDGQIYRISVNKNGYVSVLLKNTTYKSIIVVFDLDGNELFKTYLATSYAICSEISNDNNLLAVGQVDYSGTIIKSIVKIINIELVKENPQDSIVYTYESEFNKILNNVKFNSKNEAICMFDSYIQKVTSLSDEKIYDIKEENILVDVNLDNNIVIVEKESSGLFSYDYQINIKNTVGKTDSLYILEKEVPKKMFVTRNLICTYLANEVRIINSNGWLLKRYTTKTEIQDIVVGDSIIGIVYNNKVEIINI